MTENLTPETITFIVYAAGSMSAIGLISILLRGLISLTRLALKGAIGEL